MAREGKREVEVVSGERMENTNMSVMAMALPKAMEKHVLDEDLRH